MLHGLLHLKGMDHEADNGAMARREARLRAQLKLPLGLIERVAVHKQKQAAGAKAPARKKSPAMPGLKPRPTTDLSTSDRPTSRKSRVAVRALPPLPQKLGKDGAPRAVAGLKKMVRKKAGLKKAAR
jgi:probable rRNA maturation factor